MELLKDFFEESLVFNSMQPDTKAYLIKIFSDPKLTFTNQSLTLVMAKAKFEGNFSLYQALGDEILITRSVFPRHLSGATVEYYDAIGQESYYRCYRMIRSWKIFEELAEMLPIYVENFQKFFSKSIVTTRF